MRIKFYFCNRLYWILGGTETEDPLYSQWLEYLISMERANRYGYWSNTGFSLIRTDADNGFWIEFDDTEHYLATKLKFPYMREYNENS